MTRQDLANDFLGFDIGLGDRRFVGFGDDREVALIELANHARCGFGGFDGDLQFGGWHELPSGSVMTEWYLKRHGKQA